MHYYTVGNVWQHDNESGQRAAPGTRFGHALTESYLYNYAYNSQIGTKPLAIAILIGTKPPFTAGFSPTYAGITCTLAPKAVD